MTDVLIQPILRGWTTSTKPTTARIPAVRSKYRQKDELVLFFDTETTSDAIQALRFGAFIFGSCKKDGTLEIYERGLFVADEPPPGDEAAPQEINEYAASHDLKYLSTQQFCEQYLWKYGCKKGATVIGFNLPFDISRVAVRAAPSRKEEDGFSFKIFRNATGKEYTGGRPSILIKKLGAKKQSIKWGAHHDSQAKGNSRKHSAGKFIDVHQAVAAHTGGASFSLAACAELYKTDHQKSTADYDGPVTAEYLGYCLNDVLVTAEVYQGVLRQHLDRKSGAPLDKIFSTASLSKALMDDMGVIPPMTANPDFPSQVLGLSMASFIGARTEAHVVNVPVPGRLLDFTSMYPTIGSLMDLTRFLRCEKIQVEDATQQVREMLASVTHDKCFDKNLWPQICGIATVKPGITLTVPVRADYGGSGTQVSVTRFAPSEPLPYAIPDLVAASILDGKPPEIERAWRFVPVGVSPFLMKALLPGRMSLDITKNDLFRTLVEMRNNYKKAKCDGHGSELTCVKSRQCEHCSVSLYLKILSNALYGIFAEMNPVKAHDKDKLYTEYLSNGTTYYRHRETWSVWAHGDPVHKLKLDKPEEPGRFCFPPLAMLFTSGARLMLAMLERKVTDAGGTYAMMDTDSMFLVAAREHGVIQAGETSIETLSYKEVDAIAESFQALSPYSQGISLLKREYPKNEYDDGWCIAISSKRYALFSRENPDDLIVIDGSREDDYFRIDKRSEHGLGYLKDPALCWRDDGWKWVIANKVRGFYDQSIKVPDWFSLPAIGQHTITTPWLMDAFSGFNDGKPYPSQVKPFNFMSVAYQQPSLASRTLLRLVAPYIDNVVDAESAPWFDIYSGEPRTITTDTQGDTDSVGIKTFASVMHEYLRHAELKAAGTDGLQATGRTTGQLRRLSLVQAAPAKVQGKEYNEQEEQSVHLKTEAETTLSYFEGTNTQVDARLILESEGLDPNRPDATEVAALKARTIVAKNGITTGSSTVTIKVAAELIRKKKNGLQATAGIGARDSLGQKPE